MYKAYSVRFTIEIRHRAITSTRWRFAFALCCHSNATRAPIANSPNSAQLGGIPQVTSGLCFSVGMWPRTDRHTDARDNYTFRVVYDLAKCNDVLRVHLWQLSFLLESLWSDCGIDSSLWLHFACVVDDAKCIVGTGVCVSVCVSVRGRMPTLKHKPDVTWGMPPSCALFGGFAIGARVALLWQVGNITRTLVTSLQLSCFPRYDNIVRTRNVSECSVLALCVVVIVNSAVLVVGLYSKLWVHYLYYYKDLGNRFRFLNVIKQRRWSVEAFKFKFVCL